MSEPNLIFLTSTNSDPDQLNYEVVQKEDNRFILDVMYEENTKEVFVRFGPFIQDFKISARYLQEIVADADKCLVEWGDRVFENKKRTSLKVATNLAYKNREDLLEVFRSDGELALTVTVDQDFRWIHFGPGARRFFLPIDDFRLMMSEVEKYLPLKKS